MIAPRQGQSNHSESHASFCGAAAEKGGPQIRSCLVMLINKPLRCSGKMSHHPMLPMLLEC